MRRKLLSWLILLLAGCSVGCGKRTGKQDRNPADRAETVPKAPSIRRKLSPEWVRTWGSALPDKILIKEQAWDVLKIKDSVVVTGTYFSAPRNQDLFIRRYRLDGTLMWEKSWDNGRSDAGFVLAGQEGSNDHFLVGGYTKVGTVNKSLLQKYDLDGNLLWTRTWGDIRFGHHEIDGIAVAGDAIYVTHWDAKWLMRSVRATVKKLDLKGKVLWSRTFGNPNKVTTADGHIYADHRGVWFTGRIDSDSLLRGGDAYLARFDPQGNPASRVTFGGAKCDDGLSMASDGKHIFVSGMSDSYSLGGYDAFLFKYDMEGKLIWRKIAGGPGHDYSRGLAIDDMHVYMAMSTTGQGAGDSDTVLLRYAKQSGTLQQERRWDGGGKDDVCASLCHDSKHIYMVGKTTSRGAGGFDSILIKVAKEGIGKKTLPDGR